MSPIDSIYLSELIEEITDSLIHLSKFIELDKKITNRICIRDGSIVEGDCNEGKINKIITAYISIRKNLKGG